MRKNRHMATVFVAAMLVGTTLSSAALGAPADDPLSRAVEAVEIGQSHASEMALAAAGQTNRAGGLARASEALAAAAERKLTRGEQDNSGRGIGRGHAAEVQAILLGDGSPSDLSGHGQAVKVLAEAFEFVRGSDRAAEVRKNNTDE